MSKSSPAKSSKAVKTSLSEDERIARALQASEVDSAHGLIASTLELDAAAFPRPDIAQLRAKQADADDDITSAAPPAHFAADHSSTGQGAGVFHSDDDPSDDTSPSKPWKRVGDYAVRSGPPPGRSDPNKKRRERDFATDSSPSKRGRYRTPTPPRARSPPHRLHQGQRLGLPPSAQVCK